MLAKLRVVGSHTVADLEAYHLGTDGRYDTDGLVAGDERELGDELAFMDVLDSGY